MIKIDLHIHSSASRYKEAKGIVEDSNINKVDILLGKLNENGINMFSITDHNRFDPDLYLRIDEELAIKRYPLVKQILAGVEFDVQLEEGMPRCHIITIFDAKNKKENYLKIYDAIEADKLLKPEEMYSKDRFEAILKEIGLPVILIAHQKCSLDRKKDTNNSLSGAAADSDTLIFGGYISALEFGKPNQEGIIKNNLRRMNEIASLITGSDCHDWTCYPQKDKNAGEDKFFTTLYSLPTFKGLHLALTSPETRIGAKERKCKMPLENFIANGIEHRLSNGIIAVIGENGSGKSTLLEFLAGEANADHQKRIKKANGFKVNPRVDSGNKCLIRQGSIVEDFHDKKLFPNSSFNDVEDSPFIDAFRDYGKDIKAFIESSITFYNAEQALIANNLEIKNNPNPNNFYININNPNSFTDVPNKHDEPKVTVKNIIKNINKLLGDPYYQEYHEKLSSIISSLNDILEDITRKWKLVETEGTVKNILSSVISDYLNNINIANTSLDTAATEYINKRNGFIDLIVNAVRLKYSILEFPAKPQIFEGTSEKRSGGFRFTKQTGYHNQDVCDEFFRTVFNQGYQSEESLSLINTIDEFVKAVRGCTAKERLAEIYNSNVEKFITEKCKTTEYIIDSSKEIGSIGNTLGEMSLAYLRYTLQQGNDFPIYIIDQPEDHISNQKISSDLIKYLNSIRYQHQVIIATHNPLLVVNLDVDQVIYLNKINDKISIVSGPLEQDDENGNILEIIASTMDGGKEAIKKRMKIYE